MILQRIITLFGTFSIPFLHVTREKFVYCFHNKFLKRVYYTLQIQKLYSSLLRCHKRFFRLLTSRNLLRCTSIELCTSVVSILWQQDFYMKCNNISIESKFDVMEHKQITETILN